MDAGRVKRNLRDGQVDWGSRPRISPDISSELMELDPLLNVKWQFAVSAAFKTLSLKERNYAYHRYLAPKGITIDAGNKRLVFIGRPSLLDVKAKLDTPKLISLAVRLEATLAALRELRDAIPYADLLEGSISLVDDFNPDESLRQIGLKRALRQAYLDALVLLTHEMPLLMPTTHRGLTSEAVRDFLVGVFLKHQILGHRFRAHPAESLRAHTNAFIRQDVADEACTRQCEVVSTERYLFLIGPVKSFLLNPYSVRRFLYEDTLLNGSAVFFSGMAIPFSSLEKKAILAHLSWSLSRIVTVERQVGAGVMAMVATAQKARVELLLPLLATDMLADGSGMGAAIATKLRSFEELLVSNVLARLPQAVFVFAKTNDDHDYLFFNMRAYVLQLAADIRSFSSQFPLVFNDAAEELELRLLSYLRLLEKRRDVIFSLHHGGESAVLDDAKLPLLEFKALVRDYEPKARQLIVKMLKIQQAMLEPSGRVAAIFDKAFNSFEKRRVTLNRLEVELSLKKKQCLVGLVRICKRHPNLTVYLELEGLVVVNEALRRYALPAGKDGIARLPILVALWEDQLAFDFEAIAKLLGVAVKV